MSEDFNALINSVKQTAWQVAKLLKANGHTEGKAMEHIASYLDFKSSSQMFAAIKVSPDAAKAIKAALMHMRSELKARSPGDAN